MAWVKIDDQIADHPKIIRAGPLAAWLFVCGLAYCARLMTDGFIPRQQVPRLTRSRYALRLAGKLVDEHLWEQRADGDFEVHDYLQYQLSAAQIRAERISARERMQGTRFGRTNGEVQAKFARSSDAPYPSRPLSKIPSGSSPPIVPPNGGDGSPRPKRRRRSEDEAPVCSCEQRREWLKVNKNTNPYCDIHGDVRDAG